MPRTRLAAARGHLPRRPGARVSLSALAFHLAASVIILLTPTATRPALAASTPSREAQLTAVFLYNFAQFTEWPAEAFNAPTAPLEMGVISPDAGVADALTAAVSGKSVGGRTIVIRRFANAGDARPCHVLYAEGAAGTDLGPRLEQFRKSAVLTVGNSQTFIEVGGTVRLYTEGNKMRFEINLPAAEQARLKISAQLLKVAKIR